MTLMRFFAMEKFGQARLASPSDTHGLTKYLVSTCQKQTLLYPVTKTVPYNNTVIGKRHQSLMKTFR